MDDYLESSPTAKEATQKAKDLVTLLSLGGFNLTKFLSNDPNNLQQTKHRALSAKPTMANSYRQKSNHHTYSASRGTTTQLHLLLAETPTLTQNVLLLKELSSTSSPPFTTLSLLDS